MNLFIVGSRNLGTNESKYEWMDEGFCSYAQYEVLNYLYDKNVLNPLLRQYKSYYRLANSEFQNLSQLILTF